jgi:hypothetical protein
VQQDCSSLVEDAEVHGASMEIDAAVVSVVLGVESHKGLLGLMVHEPRAYFASKIQRRPL